MLVIKSRSPKPIYSGRLNYGTGWDRANGHHLSIVIPLGETASGGSILQKIFLTAEEMERICNHWHENKSTRAALDAELARKQSGA